MNTQPARWLPLPRSGAFVREVFDEDLRRLWFFYREQGFDDAEIVDAPVEVDDATGAIDVTVVIDEGPRTIVDDGPPAGPERCCPPAKQEVQLVPSPAKPLLPAELDADAQAIRRALRSDGYAEADGRAGGDAPPIRPMRGAGGRRLEDRARAAPRDRRDHGAGQRRDAQRGRAAASCRSSRATRSIPKRCSAVRTRSTSSAPTAASRCGRSDPPAEVQDVGVEVVPRPPGSMQWGAGYNTRDGITGFGEMHARQRRPPRPPHYAARPGQRHSRRSVADAVPRHPRLPRAAVPATPTWQWTAELIGERSTKTIDQFSVLRGSFGNGFARDLLPRLKGGAELQLERADVFDVKPQSFLNEDRGHLVHDGAVAVPGLRRPQRPVRADQRRVRQPAAALRAAGRVDRPVRQAQPAAQPGVPAGRVGCRSSTRRGVGYGRAFSGAEVLPIRERYFLGGSTTVRGFSENSLGPIDPVRPTSSAATWRWCSASSCACRSSTSSAPPSSTTTVACSSPSATTVPPAARRARRRLHVRELPPLGSGPACAT